MSSGFLSLIVDANPNWWATLLETRTEQEQATTFQALLTAISAFCNAFVLQDARNQLLVLAAAHGIENPVLYSSDSETTLDAGSAVQSGLQNVLRTLNEAESTDRESPLAAPLVMALCRLNRVVKESTAVNASETQNCRVMVLKLSDHTTTEHLKLMNMFFAAQKQGVLIDACLLNQDCALMQQACDITGGLYHRVDNLKGLLQYLLTLYLPSTTVMNKLKTPPSGNVDYRPACFCHNKFVSLGWVCSVCLAVFCQFMPICPTCQTAFKFLPARPKTKKRKKPADA